MLSERYRPKTWDDFIGQPVIDEIREACGDSWLFDGCGERWLFESDGIAGCGKTSAAYVTARALGCTDFTIERIDSRACSVADLRALDGYMRSFGMGSVNGRRCFIIDEIQHLNRDCLRMLLGILEDLPTHVIVIGTTTSLSWADDNVVDKWERSGISLHIVDLGGNAIDTTSAAGRFMLVVLAGAAEMERNLTRERTRSAMAVKKANGQRVGTVPYGYDLGEDGATLLENLTEQTVIAEIGSMRAGGMKLQQIAATLTARRIPTKTGKPVWAHKTVARILGRGHRPA